MILRIHSTISTCIISEDKMDGFMQGYYHLPEGNTSMIADVIPATIGTKTPASLHAQDLQAQDLQAGLLPIIKHMKQNGTIGLQITYLQELPTLTRLPSRHMQLGTLTIIYLTMEPQMLSESMSLINDKISVSSTLVPIVSFLPMIHGSKIPTLFR